MKKLVLSALAIGALTFTSCGDDNDTVAPMSNLTLNIAGLENLGADYMYEGWIIVNGSPVTTGTFSVDDNGALSKSSFSIDKAQLDSATKFVLSIEPANDTDPAPSDIKILAGDFSGTSASLNTGIIADFSNITGQYVLATPSTTITTDNNKGVWFLKPTDPKTASLSLPILPTGWMYEGWAIVNGKPISTGKFTMASGADADGNPYAGTDNTMLPPFPGEDLIMGMVNGVNLAEATYISKVVVSIEPVPDTSTAPFLLKPLVGEALTANAATMPTLHTLNKNLLIGSISR